MFIRVKAPQQGLTASGVTMAVFAAGQRAGLGTIYAHRLRHSAATAIFAEGGSLAEIGQVLRHRRPATTRRPLKVNIEELPRLGVRSRTKVLCPMPCRAGLLARCSLPRRSAWMPVRCRRREAGGPASHRSAITSSVDSYRAGYDPSGPAEPAGLAALLPGRAGEQASGRKLGRAEAELIKSRRVKGKARVTFTIDPRVGAQTAVVCGEWNDWSADADVMRRDAEGGFSVTVDLDAGRAYRFRYLLDGQRWDNDWAADAYVCNDFGGDDSVVDLTALAEAVPSAARRTLTKKTASAQTAKMAAPARKRAEKPAK